jgi:hypothetical protein
MSMPNNSKSAVEGCSNDDDSWSSAEYEDEHLASFSDEDDETTDLLDDNSDSLSYSTDFIDDNSDSLSYPTATGSAPSPMNNNSTSEQMTENSLFRMRPSKKVRFRYAQVREYNLTVGSHTAAADSCPLQLSWEHTEDACVLLQDHSYSSSSIDDAVSLHKLSLEERRERIALVQNISLARVRELEYEIVLQQIEAAMEVTKIVSQQLQGILATDNNNACSDMSPRTAMIKIPRVA